MLAPQKSVLFVCTGNVFRSLAAQCALKNLLSAQHDTSWLVDSAGTVAAPQQVHPQTIATLAELHLGDNFSHHIPLKLTRDMLDTHAVVVAMATYHQDFMIREFGYESSLLFNALAGSGNSSVLDIGDAKPESEMTPSEIAEHIDRTVRDIYTKTPAVYASLCELE